MKKLLFFLCLFSMTAQAEWKFFAENNFNSGYIDYSRINTEGKYKSLWYLFDFKSPDTNSSGKQYKSTVAKSIVDCQASKYQDVAIYQYSGHMGLGEVVISRSRPITESEWSYPPPNSFADMVINIACGRK
jgi:hypothetical protein